MQDPAIEDKVLDALREFAGVVGQTAETLWPMAVKATWAESFSAVAVSSVVLLFVSIMIPFLWGVSKRYPQNSDARTALSILPSVFGILFGLVSVVFIGLWLPGLIAPEGITLFELLK